MKIFPAFFAMQGAHVAVFGAGDEALRKVRLLAKTPAEIRVIADAVSVELRSEFGGRIVHVAPGAAEAALEGAAFAIVALEDAADAAQAAALARAAGVPVNVVDRPELCDFTVPSILDRGDLVAAIATGGAAPVLAKTVRTRLEALMPQGIGALATLSKSLRPAVADRFHDGADRRRFWERALTGAAAERAYAGDLVGAEAEMRRQLAEPNAAPGVVHIVGAGPGDPELLTLKAFRLIQNAEIVFYDRLVSDAVLDLVRRDADRVSVGKSKGDHSVPQGEIHLRMIEAAREGKRVVRLKGGDPFIFGRGGEELEAVQAAGIDVHVVPGISSALGCAASAGLPLTHRDHAQAVTFVTGHARKGGVPDLDWAALAHPAQTLVVFMGLDTAAAISEHLIRAGRAPSTPVAIIEKGTRPDESRVYGRLAELPQLIAQNQIESPGLVVIGDVAGLPEEAVAGAALEAVA
ncbi:MAG: siroheme synthase CysG [Pseudomonadota bacterium]